MRRFLAALLLALCLPLWQAWAAIGTPTNIGTNAGTAGTTLIITTTATAAVNDTILVACAGSTVGVSAVTDSSSNSYTQDKTGTNSVVGTIYRGLVTTQLTSGGTITATK